MENARRILLMLCYGTLSSALFMKENVFFLKTNEVALSRSSWRLTMVADLGVYDDFFDRTLNYIQRVDQAAWDSYRKFVKSNVDYGHHFNTLRQELTFINRTRERLFDKFSSYHLLHDTKNKIPSRRKKALLPFVGSVYSVLFGLTTDSDLIEVRQAVNDLSSNQQKIRHVVNQSLTVMNKTREEVIENRIRINEIQNGIIKLSIYLDNFINNTSNKINGLTQFLHFYIKLNTLVSNAQELVVELVQHFEDLGRQVDSLSTGKLTPGVISPQALRNALIEIGLHLPTMLQLPMNPQDDLWTFYQTVKCDTIIDNNKILIMLNIPLINQAEKMDIYKVINLPLPFYESNGDKSKKEESSMIAYYNLETKLFAIDHSRTRYSLLTPEIESRCVHGNAGFCQFIEPLYPVNLSPYCIITLFVGNSENIKDRCTVKVRPNSILPVAKHVKKGLWVIALNKPLVFTFTCDYNNITVPRQTKIVVPPVDTISLPQGCVAFSSKIVLPSYQEFSSTNDITASLPFNVKDQNFTLWEPLRDEVKLEGFSWNLTKLDDIEEIKMNDLIQTLKSVKKVKVSLNPLWRKENIILSAIIFFVIILTLTYIIYRCYKRKVNATPLTIETLVKPVIPTAPEAIPMRRIDLERAINAANESKEVEGNPYFNIYPFM